VPDRAVVDDLSLDVRGGEIVCLYALMVAGRTELLEAVAGRGEVIGGAIPYRGEELHDEAIGLRIDMGIGLVPEARHRDGLAQTLNIAHHLTLASIRQFLTRGLLSRRKEATLVERIVKDVTVKTSDPSLGIGSLSGGNQQ